MKFKKKIALTVLLICALTATAQGPNGSGTYYSKASGLSGKSLKTALFNIIKNHRTISYDGLIDSYKVTDTRADGYVRDWYSNTTKFKHNTDKAGSYQKEGDVYNREHSVPQSWFSKATPMKSDIVHVIPTDGYVNGRRGNIPYGETNAPTYTSNNAYSKVGPCSVSGYTGKIFEPNDEIKGDIARIYFYMITCYQDKYPDWANNNATASEVFDATGYPGLKKWTLDMMMRWAKEDPVDAVEVKRNNGVYSEQGNRNPFVDYPGLEEYTWGSKMQEIFVYDNYSGGTVIDPTPDPGPDPDPDPDPNIDPDPTPDPQPVVDGTNIFKLVTQASQLQAGHNYLIVYESSSTSGYAYSGCDGTRGNGVEVTIKGDSIDISSLSTQPHSVVLQRATSANDIWYMLDGEQYLALTSSSNALNLISGGGENAQWKITVSSQSSTLTSVAYSNRTLRYNTSAKMFRCYTSGQQPVSLYVQRENASTTAVTSPYVPEQTDMPVYTIQGQRLSEMPTKRGLYIIGGRKVLVK